LDPARNTVSPITAQTQTAIGKTVPLEISQADVAAADDEVKLPSSGNAVIFKPVKTAATKPSVRRSAPAPVLDNIEAYHRIAPWSRVPGSMLWTRQAVESIQAHMTSLNRARDINEFCPGYTRSTTTESQHIACWIRILGGIMEKESGFRTNDSLIENSGEASVGLLAMSAGQCPNAPSSRALKNPVKNIDCAVNVMAYWIHRDGYISGPRNQGAARNWSCLQKPHKVYVRSIRKKVRVGFKQEIIRVASNYDRLI
jgi:hypothetical protein